MKDKLANATVIDVRTQDEYHQEHYPGAINVPLDAVPQRMEELKKMKTPIVMYCRSGNRSGIAVNLLKQGGVAEVYNGGGLSDLM